MQVPGGSSGYDYWHLGVDDLWKWGNSGGGRESFLRWSSNHWDSEGLSAEYSGEQHFARSRGNIYSGGETGDLLDGRPLLPGIHTNGYWSRESGGWITTGFVVIGSYPSQQAPREAAPMITRANVPEPSLQSPGERYRCDKIIAYLFSDGNLDFLSPNKGPVAATTREPSTHRRYPGLDRSDHLAGTGSFHIYGNELATRDGDAALYLPRVENSDPFLVSSYNYQEPRNETFTNLFRYKYNNGLVMEVFHVGGTVDVTPKLNSGKRGSSKLGSFTSRNAAGLMQIGYIGGLGGNVDPYNTHTHIQFRKNGRIVDPRSVFCGD